MSDSEPITKSASARNERNNHVIAAKKQEQSVREAMASLSELLGCGNVTMPMRNGTEFFQQANLRITEIQRGLAQREFHRGYIHGSHDGEFNAFADIKKATEE